MVRCLVSAVAGDVERGGAVRMVLGWFFFMVVEARCGGSWRCGGKVEVHEILVAVWRGTVAL